MPRCTLEFVKLSGQFFVREFGKLSGRKIGMHQKGGIAYAIHSLNVASKFPDSEAILSMDAKKISMVSSLILPYKTLQKICPSLYQYISTSYREPSNFFVKKQAKFFQEDKTHSNRFAVSMYGIAIIPLMELIDDCFTVQNGMLTMATLLVLLMT